MTQFVGALYEAIKLLTLLLGNIIQIFKNFKRFKNKNHASYFPYNTPATGFVNEQGAFFADQSSDQSVHVSQQPLLPQVLPPHSTQAPHPGQEDADSDWSQGRQYPRGKGKDEQTNRADGGRTKTDKMLVQ